MRIISTSYTKTASYTDPQEWLKRISFYTGLLKQLAVSNEVIGIERISYVGELLHNGVQYYFIKQNNATAHFPFRVHKLVKKLSPDVVMVNGFIFPHQLIQLRIHIGSKPRIIVLNRAEKPAKGIKKYLQKIADRFVYAYLFSSADDGIKWVKAGIIRDKNKIREVVQASSDLSKIDKVYARTSLNIDGSKIFLWVGRLDRNKDPVTVVRAFLAFAATDPWAKLYMIFQEDDVIEQVKEITAHSKHKESIVLIGKVDHAMLGNWYSAADFFISGSHSEGSGIALMEAMSCGCIPIITRIPSFLKMTANGICGLLYEAGNHAELYSFLIQTGKIDQEKESLKVLEQFRKELSFEAIAGRINEIIREQ